MIDQRIARVQVYCTQSAGGATVIDKKKDKHVSMSEEQFDKIEKNMFFN